MRRILIFGTMALMVLLAGAMVIRADDGPEGAPGWQGPPQGQHQFGEGGQHQWGGMDHGQFGRRGGFGHERRGWQRGGRGFGGGAGLLRLADNPRVREELKLTDDQVSRLHSLAVESEKTSIRTRADLQLRELELRELLRADNPNREAILSKVQEISDLRGQTAKQHMETMLSARSVLTPEQLKKVRSFMENRGRGGPGGPERERMMEHRGAQGRPSGRPAGGPGAPPNPPAHPTYPPTQ